MFDLQPIIQIIKSGGIIIYPLLFLALIATILICDKILSFYHLAILPKNLSSLIKTYNFKWQELAEALPKLKNDNYYRRFFEVILANKDRPIWWIESRAEDESMLIEKEINRGLWALETIITAAPLLGLFGTIIGMMHSFKLIGADNIVNPSGITAGVAQALIATALGLIIAILALFAFNYFSKLQDQVIDELERLGTKIIDHIKLDKIELDKTISNQ